MLACPRLGLVCEFSDIEAVAVVADLEDQPAIFHHQRDRRNGRVRVPDNIAQRLLRNAEDAQRDVLRKFVGHGLDVDVDAHTALTGNVLALGLQRLLETQVIEYRRVQAIRQRMDVVAQPHEIRVHRCPVARRWHCLSAFEAGRIDGKAREALRHIVVQFAGKPSALVFVHGEQTPAERGRLALGATTPGALCEERQDESGLHDKESQGRQDDLLVLLPHRRRAKQYLASRRKPGLVDVPALELAPVESRRGSGKARHLVIVRPLATKHPTRDLRGNGRTFHIAKKRAAYRSQPQFAFVEAEYRHAGSGAQLRQSVVLQVRNACRIDVQEAEQDHRSRLQRSHALAHLR